MASGSTLILDCTPKPIREFLGELHLIGDRKIKISRLEEYVNCLEEEQKKVDPFKRELPLCMLLLTDAIEVLREEEMKWRKPVVQEFLSPSMSKINEGGVKMEKDNRDKKNWMSSAQLWSNINNDNCCSNNNFNKTKASCVKERKDKESEGYAISRCKYSNQGGGFVPFKGIFSFRKEEKEMVFPLPSLSLLSPDIKTPSAESGGDYGLNSKGVCKGLGSSVATSAQSNLQPRKARRCWSPELHRRFVNALHELGGPQG